MNNELCLLSTGSDKIRLPHSDIGDDDKRPSGRRVLIKRTWVPTHLPDDADESRRERFDNDDDDNYYYRKNCIRRFRRGRSGGWTGGGYKHTIVETIRIVNTTLLLLPNYLFI